MERNSGLRRVSVSSGFIGLQKRRSVRDSREEVELRDRDQLRNDRDRDLIRKRRRVGESLRRNESDESSDEESYEEEERKIHQKTNRMNKNQSLSIRSNNRRSGLRSLRSSPVFRTAVDELFGVPIPRKARSASTKRLHEQLNRRRFSTESPIGVGGFSPSSSSGGSSVRKKMKSVEPRLLNKGSDSVIQDDIEFEVAEALFDLMKQSQFPINGIDDSKRLKAFSVQNEKSIEVGVETVTVDPVEEMNDKGISEKEKLSDDKVEELLSKEKVIRESELPSCVKVNACRFQDQTVTKLDGGSGYVGTNKEAKFDTGLMATLKLCASSGKEVSVDAPSNSKVTSLDVTERRENISKQPEKIETARSSQLANLDLEKYAHDAAVRDGSKQPWGLKEQKSQPSNSLLPFSIPMNGWHGVLPHPGYMTSLQALPVDGNVRSTISVQTPQFKFSQPRTKRSTTHQHIALSIQSHHQLIKKSMSSGLTGASNFYSSKQLNLNLEATELKFMPENLLLGDHSGGSNNRSSEVAKAMKTSTTVLAPQQATDQFPAAKFFGPALILPFGHNQSASAVNDVSLPSNSALNLPAMSFNQQNMAILQKNGSSFPIPPNIALQKNGIQVPALPFFNSSFYSSPVFDASQNQQHSSLPHASLVQSTSQNTTSSGSSSRKPPRGQKQTGPNDNKSAPDTIKNSLIPSNGQLFSVPIQPMNGVVTKNRDSQQKGYQAFPLSFGSNPSTNYSLNFQMLPDLPRDSYQKFLQASESKSTVGLANLENGLKGIFEKIPESNGAQSHNFTKSGCTADLSASMFDGLARTMNIGTSSAPGNSITIPNFNQHHQQLIQLQKHHMQLNGVKDPIFSSLQWDNLPQQVKSSQGQTHISFGNMPVPSAPFQGRNIESPYNPSLGNLRNASSSSALSSHPVDVSQSGPGQKSSPACRRNVPSILSTCTSQPSELKY